MRTAAVAHQEKSTEDYFGSLIAKRLTDSVNDIDADILARLRFARNRAINAHLRKEAAVASFDGGTLTLTQGGFGLWWRLASVIPLLALIIGIIAINVVQSDNHIQDLADIDSALLTDDLPPSAYVDAGFKAFIVDSQNGMNE